GAQEFVARLVRHPEYGMLPVGFVDGRPQPVDPELDVPIVGATERLPELASAFDADRVVIDAETVHEDEILGLVRRAAAAGIGVTVLPTLARHLSTAISVEGVAG